MSISQSGPANQRAGVKKGIAPHPANKKSGFDPGYGYADFSKTKVGIGKDKKKS